MEAAQEEFRQGKGRGEANFEGNQMGFAPDSAIRPRRESTDDDGNALKEQIMLT
jgi:hypothetical protein